MAAENVYYVMGSTWAKNITFKTISINASNATHNFDSLKNSFFYDSSYTIKTEWVPGENCVF